MNRVTCLGVTVIFINVQCFDEVILSGVSITLTSATVNLSGCQISQIFTISHRSCFARERFVWLHVSSISKVLQASAGSCHATWLFPVVLSRFMDFFAKLH